MPRKIWLLMVLTLLLHACSTAGGVSNYKTFTQRFGSAHAKHSNIDGWYQIPVRLPRDVDLERPFVEQARTARAPMYHQLVDVRRNTPALPPLYCNYVFTFDQTDRLRSVAVREESCSRDPI